MSCNKGIRAAIDRLMFSCKLPRDLSEWLSLRRRRRLHPEWQWQRGSPCPQKRVEAGRVQIGSKLFVFGGYVTLAQVSRRVDLYDLATDRWQSLGELPPDAPETHAGLTYDGRDHILMVSGQLGGNCSPASPRCFSFHIHRHEWAELPPLPEARYMPIVHHHEGRLHCLSGMGEHRATPATERWSLEVEDGRALQTGWRTETPLPSPRNHTASILSGSEVLIFGGQCSDVPPLKDDPLHHCDFDSYHCADLDEVYAFDLKSGEARQLARLPVKLGHTDQACVRFGSTVIIAGGTIDNLTSDLIFCYDMRKDEWRQIGRLPYPMKSKIAASWNGRLFLVAGQRAASESDLRPHEVLDTVWHAAIPDLVPR